MRLLAIVVFVVSFGLAREAEARPFHLLESALTLSSGTAPLPGFEAQPLRLMDDGGGAGASVGAFPWLIEAAVLYLGALTAAGLGTVIGAVLGGALTGNVAMVYIGAAIGSLVVGGLATIVLLAITSAVFNAPGGNGLLAGLVVGAGMAVAVALQLLVPVIGWIGGLLGLGIALGAEYVHRGGFPDFQNLSAPAAAPAGSGDSEPALDPQFFRPSIAGNLG